MATLAYTMTTSLDGYIEDRDGSFAFAVPDDALHQHANDETRATSAFLFGRRLYETMEGPWREAAERDDLPEVEAEFARLYLAIPRYVFSDTLDEVPDGVTLVRSSQAEAVVARLKDELDGDLGIGGAGLAASLAGHLDEIRVRVMPSVVGGGTPVLAVDERLDLQLVEHRVFDSGAVFLRYTVTPSARSAVHARS